MRNLTRSFRRELPNAKTLPQKVAAILRKKGTDAHVYLPGIGVINGLTAGNYLDSAGTTAATVDNPVGLVLDGAGSVGDERVTNGGFTQWTGDNPNNWTLTFTENATNFVTETVNGMRFVCDNSTATTEIRQDNVLTVGKTYEVTVVVSAFVKGSFTFSSSFNPGASPTPSAIGTYTWRLNANSTSLFIRRASATDFTIRSISVKEVTGIHATQGTTANKPILRRGAVNLLTYSEQFDNADWTKQNGGKVNDNVQVGPNGSISASLFFASTATYRPLIQRSLNNTGTSVFSIHIKPAPNGANTLQIHCYNGTMGNIGININLSTMTITSGAFGDAIPAGAFATPVGNGWYRVGYQFTPLGGTYSVNILYNSTPTANQPIAYIFGAQLQVGTSPTDYVATTTAPASSATGNYHWMFDSTDLLTATFPAGYESATVVDARNTGQVTLTAQNIVGAYNIGSSIDTYGRFIFRTGLTAGELTTIQTFANRLAGV